MGAKGCLTFDPSTTRSCSGWSARGVRLEVSLFRHSFVRGVQAAACVLISSAALAQSQIVVTGSREPAALDRLAADVVLIDAAAIRASTADSVADLLRREAGLQVSRSGGPGQSTGLFIRGASSSQTVVLVDGVRIGSATLGSAGLETLGLAQIDRIEVLRGPGSSLYGADAVGGVVQIFTRRGQAETRFDARAAIGGYGSGELSAAASGRAGLWDLSASASRETSDGVSALRPGDAFGNHNPDDDGYTLDSLQAQIGITPWAGQRFGLSLLRTDLDAQYDASEFLPPPSFAQDNTPDFRNKLQTTVGALDWRGTLSAGLVGSARVSRSVDDLDSGGTVIDTFKTTRDQVGAQLAYETGTLGRLTLALEQNDEEAESTSFLADVSRRTRAGLLALDGQGGSWSWLADVRFDDIDDFGDETTGRAGGTLVLMEGWRLRALAGTSFRAPSFNDLYFPGYGVPTLEPEKGTSVEFGLNWKVGAGEIAATVYRNKVRNLIGYLYIPPNDQSNRGRCPPGNDYDFGCAANIDRATLEGVTLSAAHRAGALGLKAQLDFLEARDDETGERLQRRAAHQASLSGDWTTGAWTLGAAVLRVGERPDGGKQLAAENTLDLTALWKIAPRWSVQAKLLNATDEDIEPARDYQGLGRQAWLVLRFEGGL
jgi:vitamin B12 transporter